MKKKEESRKYAKEKIRAYYIDEHGQEKETCFRWQDLVAAYEAGWDKGISVTFDEVNGQIIEADNYASKKLEEVFNEVMDDFNRVANEIIKSKTTRDEYIGLCKTENNN